MAWCSVQARSYIHQCACDIALAACMSHRTSDKQDRSPPLVRLARLKHPSCAGAGATMCGYCSKYARLNTLRRPCAACSHCLTKLRRHLSVFKIMHWHALLQQVPDPAVFREQLKSDRAAALEVAQGVVVAASTAGAADGHSSAVKRTRSSGGADTGSYELKHQRSATEPAARTRSESTARGSSEAAKQHVRDGCGPDPGARSQSKTLDGAPGQGGIEGVVDCLRASAAGAAAGPAVQMCEVCKRSMPAHGATAAEAALASCAECFDRVAVAVSESALTPAQAAGWLQAWHARELPCPICLIPKHQRLLLLNCTEMWDWDGQVLEDTKRQVQARRVCFREWRASGLRQPPPVLKGANAIQTWLEQNLEEDGQVKGIAQQ